MWQLKVQYELAGNKGGCGIMVSMGDQNYCGLNQQNIIKLSNPVFF